jgi:hypothetical protein
VQKHQSLTKTWTSRNQELSSAALQFVRKITGFHKPSRANQEAFDRAVREITDFSDRLLKAIGSFAASSTPSI